METVKKKKTWPLLFLSLLALLSLGYILFVFPPGAFFDALGLHISYIPIFFTLLFLSLYGLIAFFFTSGLQGLLISGVVVCFLLFRLLNLTNPLFIILLLVLFISIEGVVWKRK